MNAKQAKQEALMRATGVLRSYFEGDGLYNHYGDQLPETDITRIAQAFQRIIDSLEKQHGRSTSDSH